MTTSTKRKALHALIESADAKTVDLMYTLFTGKNVQHDIYGLYRDKLPHLLFPENGTSQLPGVKKPITAGSGTKKSGGKKK